ncbi:inorganic phosphate transporter [Chitinibacteraceae bacterium HSL-7]
MPEFIAGLPFWVAISLGLALLFVLSYEFINGFHDTANAVATVIYTRAMPARWAVFASGIFNFLGVLLGGVGVAYAIVHLLPVDLLINVNTGHGLVMIFALLAAAIIWNLGTWYFGIPASSSHTLIGSILGVGLANALMNDIPVDSGINWQKAIDIALSLVISPLLGFAAAAAFLYLLLRYWPASRMHKTPEMRMQDSGKKKPPFWNRVVLITSAMAMSFVHGSNDGQKGIGLIMLVLIGIVPSQFALDLNATTYRIEHTRDAAEHLGAFYTRNAATLSDYLTSGKVNGSDMPGQYHCTPADTQATISRVTAQLTSVSDYHQLSLNERVSLRRDLLCLDDTARKVAKLPQLEARKVADLGSLRDDLTATTEYAPTWVIVAVALALGLGTMIGWKRVVVTVGEKIGQQGMTYAQGMSAQIVAAGAIGLANVFHLPVSTTHVLSSGVAGTMVANRSGLQKDTVRNIVLAWVLTLPAVMALSTSLFWLAAQWV